MTSPENQDNKTNEELIEDKKEVGKRISIRQKELEDLEKFVKEHEKEYLDRETRHAKVEEIKKRKEREKAHGKDKHRHREKDRDRDRDKDREKDRDRDRDREKPKDIERHKHRDKEKRKEKEEIIKNENKVNEVADKEDTSNKLDDTLNLSLKNEEKNTFVIDQDDDNIKLSDISKEEQEVKKKKHREKHKERKKDKEKSSRHKDKDREKEKENAKDSEKDLELEITADNNDKDKERVKDTERYREKHKERDKHKNRDKEKEKDGDKDKERDKDKEKDRDKDRDRERDRDRDKERDKEKRDKHKDKTKDKIKDKDQDKANNNADIIIENKSKVIEQEIDKKAEKYHENDKKKEKEPDKEKEQDKLKEKIKEEKAKSQLKSTNRKGSVEKTHINPKSNLSKIFLKETDNKIKEDEKKPPTISTTKAKPRRTNSLEVLKKPVTLVQPNLPIEKDPVSKGPKTAVKKSTKGINSSLAKSTEVLVKPKTQTQITSKQSNKMMKKESSSIVNKSNFETPTTNKADPINGLKAIQISPISNLPQIKDRTMCQTSQSHIEITEDTNNNTSIQQQDQLEKIYAQQKQITALTQKTQQLESKIDKLKEESSLKMNKLKNELEEKQKKYEDTDISRRELTVALEECTNEKAKMSQNIIELKEDIELLQEELESKDIEVQLINNKYNNLNADYLKLKATGITSSSSSSIQPHGDGDDNNNINSIQSQNASDQLEEVLAEITAQLTKVTNERDYMVNYLQDENKKLKEDLKSKIEQLKKLDEKDKEIKELKEKAFNSESMINNLKEQISELSPANDLYEQIIIEKDELEDKYNDALDQNEKLTEEVNNCNELLTTQEESIRLSEQINKKQQNDILHHLATIAQLTDNIKLSEQNEHQLLEKLSIQKKEIETIQAELALDTDNKDIIQSTIRLKQNYNLLQKKGLGNKAVKIENEKLVLNNRILKEMLPDSISKMGGLHSLENFFYVWSLKLKIFKFLMNVIKYELIQGNETNEVLKQFYYSITDNLACSYNAITMFIERVLKVSNGNYNILNENENYIEIFNDIKAIGTVINEGIMLINADSFGVKFENQSNILNMLNKKIDLNVKGLLKEKEEFSIVIPYQYNIINAYVMIVKQYHQLKEKSNEKEKEKELIQVHKQIGKLIQNFNDFILTSSDVPNQVLLFDSVLYQKLISNDPYPDISIVSSICSSILSSIDNLLNNNKSNCNDGGNDNNNGSSIFPVKSWNNIIQQVKEELTLLLNSKEEIDNLKSDLRQSKIQLAQCEVDKKEIEKIKEYNDKQYGELLCKVGQLPQLEQEKKELVEKWTKQDSTISSLKRIVENEKKKGQALKEQLVKLEATSTNSSVPNPNSFTKHKALFNKSTQNCKDLTLSISSGESTIAQPESILMNTIIKLQKEKKTIKSNMIKEKIEILAYDHNSYMNQLIENDQMTQEKIEDKERYNKIGSNMREINEAYNTIRTSFPSVDILNKETITAAESNQLYNSKKSFGNLRNSYMNNIKDVVLELFGNGAQSSFADILQIDIEKQFNQVCNTSMTTQVASLRLGFNSNANANAEENKDSLLFSIPIPKSTICLNETSLKQLNETFMQ